MELGISYMGTKKYISPYVNELVNSCNGSGPFLDLFSGMCSVSSCISDRPIWCNDSQLFASYVANLAYTTKKPLIKPITIENYLAPFYENNFNKLNNRFFREIEKEKIILKGKSSLKKIKSFYSNYPHTQNSKELESERKRLRNKPDTLPWRMFSITYAGGYFSVQQCIEIDSIRYSIEVSYKKGFINKSQYFWLLVALANALSRCSTTTGHFAQYLKVNNNNIKNYIKQRRRSIWLEWMSAINSHDKLFENIQYSKYNKVFNEDANNLLKRLANRKIKPEIIYADPPYTKDQYSRYYHIYDTLITYDYPSSFGEGRYPPNRFRSKFSLKSEVQNELKTLISRVKMVNSSFILSYPENGLIKNTKNSIYRILKDSFHTVDIAYVISHKHSTMGASKGRVNHLTNELIFYAE